MTAKWKLRREARLAALLLALFALAPGAAHADAPRARQILDRIGPATLSDLLSAAQTQPDVALTNILPTTANRFRFVFIWPAANPVMTVERINRSFEERFLQFAAAQRFLSTGYCLTPRGIGFTSETFGQTRLNVAFRDIEVHRDIGWRETCRGIFLTIAEIDAQIQAAEALAEAEENARRLAPQGTGRDGVAPFLRGLQPPSVE